MSSARKYTTDGQSVIEEYANALSNILLPFLNNSILKPTEPLIKKLQKDLTKVFSFEEFFSVHQNLLETYKTKIYPLIEEARSAAKNKDEAEMLANLSVRFEENSKAILSDMTNLTKGNHIPLSSIQPEIFSNIFTSSPPFFSKEKKEAPKMIKDTHQELLLSGAKSDLEMIILKYITFLSVSDKPNLKKITLHQALNNALKAIAKTTNANDVVITAKELNRYFKDFVLSTDKANNEKKPGEKDKIEGKISGGADSVSIKIRNEFKKKDEKELESLVESLKSYTGGNQNRPSSTS